MRYTVVWLPPVEDQLADFWTSAPDRQAVTAAANAIDRALRDNPRQGVMPLDNLFYLKIEPLVVLCEISDDDRTVTVIEVRYLG
jgi:mRNA-degrading endonuclease RelE of RelBE toxin-antitoxin system